MFQSPVQDLIFFDVKIEHSGILSTDCAHIGQQSIA